MTDKIFKAYAPLYRKIGLEPRPIQRNTKACHVKDWQVSDSLLPAEDLESWLDKYADSGIGLRMGTPLTGGGHLGALDIDRDEYVRLSMALFGNPPCTRIGSKGTVIFVRVVGDLGNQKFRCKSKIAKDWGNVAECLFDRMLCVIPPTIHPDTQQPYKWNGTPLHELDLGLLPVIGK